MIRDTNGQISLTESNEVFVFGSNEAGIHGAGAAKYSLRHDAEMGVGFGLRGRSFAIPTKDYNIKTLPLDIISAYVTVFLRYAMRNKERIFIVTPIGCGLAGYTPEQIAPMFNGHPNNVILPEEFLIETDTANPA